MKVTKKTPKVEAPEATPETDAARQQKHIEELESKLAAVEAYGKVDVGFAQLHTELFINGKNFNVKLDTHNQKDLKLVYDKADKELIVTWKNVTAHVPSTNVVSYIPGPARDRKIVQSTSPQVANISYAQVQTPSGMLAPQPQTPRINYNPVSAQVSTPQSHVQAGLGHGQTGQVTK